MSEYLKDYAVQLIHVQPNDVILLHISEELCLDDVATIQHEIQRAFPNNTILVANENILKKITIFRADDPIQSDLISNTIDPEHNWLKPSLTSDSTGGYVSTFFGSDVYDVLY
jgi:nitrous oxide reductase